ncbi:FkbM family methyltransferase [Cerasicoccus maritimus]|uniref:FkbM family methyltransferase n=1 Tax=Cerasicoccus maritimus TaxID=490089 RepID=UPI002852C1C7|nr:FkbM family methyltransferase [Cerasicoccus maritimus]
MPTDTQAPPPDNESYSQWGEDRIIWDYFKRRSDGVFLEVGANAPIRLSQTYLLEKRGWSGVLIEPQTQRYEELVAKRPGSRAIRCGAVSPDNVGGAYIKIPPAEQGGDVMSQVVMERVEGDGCRYEDVPLRTINDALEEAGVQHVDFASIDIEGMEIPALEGFDLEKYQPKLILVEDHMEDLSLHRYLKKRGYRFINRMGSNNWYAPAGFTDFTLENATPRFEQIRKFYLSMPFRKLRITLKRLRGKA